MTAEEVAAIRKACDEQDALEVFAMLGENFETFWHIQEPEFYEKELERIYEL
jgi:hypothetical protein